MRSHLLGEHEGIANSLSGQVIGSAIEVHRLLGPGLFESAYSACLAREFDIRGISYRREVPLPVSFKGQRIDCGYRIDFIVGARLVVEIKAVETLHPLHCVQLLTYLRLSNHRVGLLFNFQVQTLKQGIKRVVNNF
jgi:GxxExxY protein